MSRDAYGVLGTTSASSSELYSELANVSRDAWRNTLPPMYTEVPAYVAPTAGDDSGRKSADIYEYGEVGPPGTNAIYAVAEPELDENNATKFQAAMGAPAGGADAAARFVAPSAGAEDPCMQDRAEAELRRLKAERRRADDADDEIEVARLSILIQAIMATQFVVPDPVAVGDGDGGYEYAVPEGMKNR